MTGNQFKAARALVGLEQIDVAKLADVSVNTIRNMEAAGTSMVRVRMDTFHKVKGALELSGVVFTPENGNGPGVALRKG